MDSDKLAETNLLQVKANQGSLILGAIIPLVFVGIFAYDLAQPVRRLNPLADLVIVALCSVISLFSGGQLIARPALVIATPAGLKLRIAYRGYFKIPWRRVQSVVVTQVATLAGHTGGARVDALGFFVREDDAFHLPAVQWNADHPAPEAPQTNLTFSGRMLQGDVQALVQKLESLRKTYANT